MTTPARTFTIFRDDAPSSPSKNEASDDEPHAPLHRAVVIHPGPQLVYNPDKENVNPLTGLRASIDHDRKKRKTDVLTTKLHIPPPSKKQKESKDSKKRTGASAPAVTFKLRVSPEKKKGKRVLASRRNGTGIGPSRQRRSPSLPRVVEEAEVERAPLSQAQVDARCYDLTVMPLADLSQAYEQVPGVEEHLVEAAEDAKDAPPMEPVVVPSPEVQRIERAKSSTPSPRVERVGSPVPAGVHDAQFPSPLVVPSGELAPFDTPERKRIYHAFTFSSPSPSGKRFAAARDDRFSDIEYEVRN